MRNVNNGDFFPEAGTKYQANKPLKIVLIKCKKDPDNLYIFMNHFILLAHGCFVATYLSMVVLSHQISV